MVENDFVQFLNKLKDVVNRNRYVVEERQSKGDFFNIFSIMRMETDEVHTHSAILRELLDPKGSHGLGDKYLIEFINVVLPANKKFSIDKDAIIVKCEHYIGNIRNEGNEGGKIDIYIETSSNIIIIENKIEAEDQEKQLIRYYNYAVDSNKNFVLFYLTLNGESASEKSIKGKNLKGDEIVLKPITSNGENGHYYVISYKENIKEWLEQCWKLSVNHPMVRETIKQYINLIDKITNTENNMGNELTDFFCKKDNWKYTAQIIDAINIEELKILLMKNAFKDLTDRLNVCFKDCGWSFQMDEEKIKNTKYDGDKPTFHIIPSKWKIIGMKDPVFSFGLFNNGEFGLYSYGIERDSGKISEQTEKINSHNTYYAFNKGMTSRLDGAVPFGCIIIENASFNFEGRVSENTHKCMLEYIIGIIADVNKLHADEILETISIEGTFNNGNYKNIAEVLPAIEFAEEGERILNELSKNNVYK